MILNRRVLQSTLLAGTIQAAAGLVTLVGAQLRHADEAVSPITSSITGHTYERVLVPMTWEGARNAARGRTFNGKHGYLATITTAEEQNIIRFGAGSGDVRECWLGGKQTGGPEPAGGWVWDNGEPWGTTQWVDLWWSAPGSPDNSTYWTGHEEDRLMCTLGGLFDDYWGGASGSLGVKGYIVEWDCVELSLTGPQTLTTCTGGTASFSVVANGTGPFTYAWHKGGTPIDTIANPSAATATLMLTNVSAADAGTYGCAVTGVCNGWTSDPATLIVCKADLDCSGSLTISDIFDFLAAWFAGNPAADFNGVDGIGITDIFDFLAAWFAGC